jgi:hypothetical protein
MYDMAAFVDAGVDRDGDEAAKFELRRISVV